MTDVSEGVSNPDLYRDLMIPFASGEAANDAMKGFCGELYDLRAKYRIQDLMFVALVTVAEGDDRLESMCVSHYGNAEKADIMAAYAMGHLAAERQQRVSEMVSRAGRNAVKQVKKRP